MPAKTPINVDFGADTNQHLEEYVWNNITKLKLEYDLLHINKVAKWRRLYRGVPKEETRRFPWKNASNVIIQLIGENVDTIRARILGNIYEVMPLYPVDLIGDWEAEQRGGEQQEIIQDFMNYVGLEPTELDLYRVESLIIDEMIKFGTVIVKSPWVTDMEAEAISFNSNSKKIEFSEFTKYDGPRPEKLRFEDWAASTDASKLEDCDFKYHVVTLTKQKLEERKQLGIYKFDNNEKWESFLAHPDRDGPDPIKYKAQQEKGLQLPNGQDCAEWDIHECWFPFRHNGKKYRIIYSFHYGTRTTLRKIFNFYPKNEEPWEMGRFGYTDDGLLGYGLCEMLEHYQEEVSSGHNQRVDNRTLANTSIFRVDPNSKLDAIFSIYPNALVPAAEGELEKIQLGANYPTSVPEEELTIRLAKSRAGTEEPGIQAAGSGTTSKRGVYSSMGTFAVLQAGNRRVNINTTDAKYLHLRLGRKFLNQYAEFGVGARANYFGNKADLLKLALENLKKGRIELPVRAASASVNKEVEKQNDLLLTQVMQRHHMGISQILQAVGNPTLPEEIKKFLVGWIDSSSLIMTRILRNFGYDDVSRLLPEKKIIQGANNGRGQEGANGTRSNGNQATATGNGIPLGEHSSEAQGPISGMVQPSMLQNVSGVLSKS
jgi:hypothetical protein